MASRCKINLKVISCKVVWGSFLISIVGTSVYQEISDLSHALPCILASFVVPARCILLASVKTCMAKRETLAQAWINYFELILCYFVLLSMVKVSMSSRGTTRLANYWYKWKTIYIVVKIFRRCRGQR